MWICIYYKYVGDNTLTLRVRRNRLKHAGNIAAN